MTYTADELLVPPNGIPGGKEPARVISGTEAFFIFRENPFCFVLFQWPGTRAGYTHTHTAPARAKRQCRAKPAALRRLVRANRGRCCHP